MNKKIYFKIYYQRYLVHIIANINRSVVWKKFQSIYTPAHYYITKLINQVNSRITRSRGKQQVSS